MLVLSFSMVSSTLVHALVSCFGDLGELVAAWHAEGPNDHEDA